MINYIFVWVKNILIYLVVVTIIENLLPESKYMKYTKVFSGMILIIIVITPFIKLVGINGYLDNSIIDYKFNYETEKIEKQNKMLSKKQQQYIINSYKKELEKQIQYNLEQENFIVKKVDVDIIYDKNKKQAITFKSVNITILDKQAKPLKKVKIDKIFINKSKETEIKTSKQIIAEKKIKNLINNFYNVSPNNIHITIQKT